MKNATQEWEGMRVILLGLGRDGFSPQFFRGIEMGQDFCFVGVGWERFENPLLCHTSTLNNSFNISLVLHFIFSFLQGSFQNQIQNARHKCFASDGQTQLFKSNKQKKGEISQKTYK